MSRRRSYSSSASIIDRRPTATACANSIGRVKRPSLSLLLLLCTSLTSPDVGWIFLLLRTLSPDILAILDAAS